MQNSLNNYLLCSGKVFALGGSNVSWWFRNAGMRSKWRRWSFNLNMCGATAGSWQNIYIGRRENMADAAETLKAAVAASMGMHALNLHVDQTTKYDNPAMPWCGTDEDEFVLAYSTAKDHEGIRLGMDQQWEHARHDAAEALIGRWRLHTGADRRDDPFVLSFTEMHRYEPASPDVEGGARAPAGGGAFVVFAPLQWTVMRASLLGLADAMLESARMK